MFHSQHLLPGYPKPLTHLGLPSSIDKIDAALVWGHNNRTYFYSGTEYWRFDEDEMQVELDYPRDMSMWKGIGYDIDSAFQNRDGKKAKKARKSNCVISCIFQEKLISSKAKVIGNLTTTA